ncbi:MAG: putative amidohydrolase YtcJ [Cryomorphaceae bacterium]|jgi:predicted amidohydrolase YtcJ
MKTSLLFAAALLSACSSEHNAEQTKATPPAESSVTIITSSAIYTANPAQAKVEAFAHDGGKIVAVGSLADLEQNFAGASKKDLGSATIIPGFIDAHGHLLSLGQSLANVDLMGTSNKAEVLSRLAKAAQGLAGDQWLIGRGWDQNDWPVKELPSKQDLDKQFPDRPVWLERVDGHAMWGNSVALGFATQDLQGEWQPDGGEIVRDDAGVATGVFIDNAVNIIQHKVPSASDQELIEALQRAMSKTASVGITGMHDAGTSLRVWRLLQSLNSDKKMRVRVYAMADGASDMLGHLCDNGVSIDPAAMLTARSVKLYSDGALGSRGAALLEDYSDDPGNQGLMIESQDTLTKHATRAVACGLQVNIHAIGDRGNRVTLDVLEAANAFSNPGRHRVEHSQVIELGDMQRFKSLGLIASVQPTHATSDMYWAEDRVGDERIKGAYAWQKFIKLGVPLALGSDFPVEQPDPLHGFYAAITRQDSKNWPAEGWYPDERLSREQALYGFTIGAAYAAFQENQLGSISIGKQADYVVLDKDIMTIPAAQILKTTIMATYLNGEAIYQSAE